MVAHQFNALLPIYLEEASDRLGSLELAVDALHMAPADARAWGAVRRVAHALAGNSAMLGLAAVAQIAHTVEQRAQRAEGAAWADRADVLFVDRGFGALRCLIECVARRAEKPLG